MSIKRLISGGQYGAEVAGLAAAKALGIETGGMAPKGYRTIYGNRPQLQKLGLIESRSSAYPMRTFDNVKNSDGTIIFAFDTKSRGTMLTMTAIHKFEKPHLMIDLHEIHEFFIFDVLFWLEDNNIETLNITGNAGKSKQESTKIFNLVKKHLIHYIHTNPLHHDIVDDFTTYQYSSFNSHLKTNTTILERNKVIEYFEDKKNYIFSHHQRARIILIKNLIKGDEE